MVDVSVLDSWGRHLRGRRRTARTIASYRSDLEALFAHCPELSPESIGRSEIEAFLESSLGAGFAATTVERRRRSIRQFYGFMTRRGLVESSPADGVGAVAECRVSGIGDREIAALLGVETATSDFASARDLAIVVVLVTTGISVSELVAMTTETVDLDHGRVSVTGRAGHRELELLRMANATMNTYAVQRDQHRRADDTRMWWIGGRGPMTASGVRQMLAERSKTAGVAVVTPSELRRCYAKGQLAHGVSVEELMAVGGWKTPYSLKMLCD